LSSSPRIRKVSALSDFAPINLKVKRYVNQFPFNYQMLKAINYPGVGKELNRINGMTTYLFFYGGPSWCAFMSLLVLKICNPSAVLHISFHHGRVWSLRHYQAASQYKRMGIGMCAYLFPLLRFTPNILPQGEGKRDDLEKSCAVPGLMRCD